MSGRWEPGVTLVAFLDYATGRGRADVGASFNVGGGFGEGCELRPLTGLLQALPMPEQRDSRGRLLPLRFYLVGVPENWWSLVASLAPAAPWTVGGRGHHVSDATPVLRFRHALTDRDVELRSASEWFGDVASVDVARDAWEMLGQRLRRLDGAPLLAGPSTTGRQMLDRAGALPEPLPAEVAATCRLGVQAGRVELRAAPAPGTRVRSLAHVDARVSYGALAQRALGVGPVIHDDNPVAPPCVCKSGAHTQAWTCPGIRARVLVRAEVPQGWDHVGILGVAGKPARYPCEPGEVFDTWADAAEVALAVQHGWSIDVHERVIFTPGKPLDGWARSLETIWQSLTTDKLPDVGADVLAAVRWAVRAIVLKTIGALAQTDYRRTRVFSGVDSVPEGIGANFYQHESGSVVATEKVALGRASYPELTAQLWARGRVRLLDAPAGPGQRAGALHVPGRAVVAMNTDALYLDGDPGWADDGSWGRYRLKGRIVKARTWPANRTALLKLRDEAERELAGTVARAAGGES